MTSLSFTWSRDNRYHLIVVSVEMERTRLCSLILRENFGDPVEQVGTYLMKNGSRSLSSIARDCNYNRSTVQKCLCSLIQHQLVSYIPNRTATHSLYEIDMNKILWFSRYAKFIHSAKMYFDDAGELIIENLLLQGQSIMSDCIQVVSEKLDDGTKDEAAVGEVVKNMFHKMVDAKLLQRVKPSTGEADGVALSKYQLPPTEGIQYKRKRSIDPSEIADEPSAKKCKREDGSISDQIVDSGIFWCVNFAWFHHHLRDKAIVQAVANKIDHSSANVMRAALDAATVVNSDGVYGTKEISSLDIYTALPPNINIPLDELDQYLTLLTDHKVKVLCKCGDSGGGNYSINYKQLDEILCQSAIESIVREKFGSKSYRIFRLLLMKRSLEQKQVADLAMIPTKEVKAILYSLVAEKYAILQEIPRSSDSGVASKNIYLFSVNLQRLTRSLLNQCYKGLGNMMSRRIEHFTNNKALMDKFNDYESKKSQLLHQQLPPPQEQLDEVEEMLTSLEKQEAEKCRDVIAKLEYAELQLDETIMFLSNYANSWST